MTICWLELNNVRDRVHTKETNWVEGEEKGRVKGNLLISILADTVENKSLRCSRRKYEFWEEIMSLNSDVQLVVRDTGQKQKNEMYLKTQIFESAYTWQRKNLWNERRCGLWTGFQENQLKGMGRKGAQNERSENQEKYREKRVCQERKSIRHCNWSREFKQNNISIEFSDQPVTWLSHGNSFSSILGVESYTAVE